MKTGTELIADERREQIDKHCFTTEYDLLKNKNGELIAVASFLLTNLSCPMPKNWPMPEYRKINLNNKKSKIHTLTIIGSLIAAEIDRLQILEAEKG